MHMFRKQLVTIVGAAVGMVVVFAVWIYRPHFAAAALPSEDTASRLAYAARWLLLPGVTLMMGIMAAARRGFIRGAIEGTRTPDHYGLEITLRYNQNTLEQTVLAAIAWIGLALALPRDQLNVIPAMAYLFFFGRITFWIGYRLHPLARAFGMVLTALPTVIAYGWLVWRWLSQSL